MTNLIARGAWLLLAPVAAAFLIFMAADDTGAQTQNFDPCGSFEVASTAPGASADISSRFGIGIGPDCIFRTADDDPAKYNFGGVINFTPEAWGVAAGEDVTDGTQVGTLSAEAVLGLFNNTCRNQLTINFQLLDGSTDLSSTITPKAPGAKDRLSPLTEDSNNNGIPDGADRWPTYLTEQFDHVPNLQSTIHARLYGHNTTSVPGLSVVLNFLVFKPGTQVSDLELIKIDQRLGYPSVTILNDPTSEASSEDAVNDFCSPLSTRTTLLGTADSGEPFRTNADADGAYPFVLFTGSQRDADGDGIENSLDTCPYDPDPDWNPRTGEKVQDPGDKDGDMIPDSCDPFPEEPSLCTAKSGISKTDEDCDFWMNGSDNCPLVPNDDQDDEDSDGIGDACDQNPTVADGETILVCKVTVVQVGAGGTPAYDPQALAPCDPFAPLPTAAPSDANGSPTPTLAPGETAAPTSAPTGNGGIAGPGDAGVGSLSPVGSSAPVWAFVVLAVSVIGLLAGFGLTTRTVRGQRRED